MTENETEKKMPMSPVGDVFRCLSNSPNPRETQSATIYNREK